MNPVRQVSRSREFKRVLEVIETQIPELIKLIVDIQQIPSPTFEEKRKANFIEQKFLKIGLRDVHKDSINNVYARIPGKNKTTKALVVSAHLDTVFSADTDLSIKKQGPFLYGPGIGDNASGVAAIITIAKLIKKFQIPIDSDIWFVGNVCEEGMGDLRGMHAVVEKFGRQAKYIVVEGGSLGQVIHKAVGVKRFRIAIRVPGGHSWGNFGEPNAIHEISHIVSEISNIKVPDSPKTTFNVGVIEGGTTINSLAPSASVLLDLRSEDKNVLEGLVSQVKSIVEARIAFISCQYKNVSIEIEQVGNRPAGCISNNDPLVKLAEEALQSVGLPEITNHLGSTDANIPLSKGISAVCVGLTLSGNSHRVDEYIDLSPLNVGLHQLLLLILAASNC